MQKYQSFIDSINSSLISFSNYLKPDYHIPLLDKSKLTDPIFCWNLTLSSWDETKFPSGESSGVYLIFGRKLSDNNFLGVYIGKSSHSSAIGHRLYCHLHNKNRNEKIYPMRDKQGDDFLLELVISIPLKDDMYFLSSALEEFLIYDLQDRNVYLLNVIGKS